MTALPEETAPPAPKWRPRLLLLVPLAFFAGLAAIFLVQLDRGIDPTLVPSVLIDHPAPDFNLPPLPGLNLPGLARADLAGHITLVNVFGSWCGPCHLEHPMLLDLARDPRIRIVGIDYKDTEAGARQFLSDLGNPYAAVGVDARGRATIDWGVYGVPETFLVGPDSVIRAKVIGPLSPESINEILIPAVAKLLAVKAPG